MAEYKVPESGIYRITSRIYSSRRTGRFERVKNPARRFWQLWKDRYVEQEIYETNAVFCGKQTVTLNAGQVVYSASVPEKIV